MNILMETKNAPKDLKRQINHTFFGNRGSQKGGEGGSDIWGKFPKNPFFFGGGSLKFLKYLWARFPSVIPIFIAPTHRHKTIGFHL